ncbi:Cna B-type domain-containing protein [Urinicoccus timonensis]|uniref:Cna B-type domain-containing protein n=1 Tax=Urinicoccus timonensis TaxID=2024205 RepID=UPI00117F1EDA|nr:Cna B-type domain-containing protein [Urinicoccus timonensis]
MILDNKALTLGGGIYTSYPPRLLELKDLLITENRAEKYAALNPGENGAPGSGGGFWSCPYGYIHIADGHSVYVFDNFSANKGADYTFRNKTRPFDLKIGENNPKTYRIEDRFHVYLSPITKDHNFIQFINDDGTGKLIPENMSYFKEKTFLKTVYNKALRAEAWRNAGAFILGNSASYGGGFGTNANHETPGDEGEIEFHFKKKWDEKIDKSDYANKDIHVDIFIVPLDKDEVYVRSQYGQDPDLYKYGEVVLNQGNNWQASFSKNDYSNYTLTKDKGLPFTKEELKKMGYKYLVMERETGYATSVEEKNAEAPIRPGTVVITRDKSRAYGSSDKGNGNADFYFYEVNKDGTLSYIGKSTKNGTRGINAEFSHEIFSDDIKAVVPYGKDRNLIEKDARWNGWKGYSENAGRYSIFVEKIEDGIVLHVPYIWTQKGDGRYGESSGIKVVKKEAGPVERKDFYGYEFTISNRPFAEAKIKKTWKLLNGDQDNGGLDNGKIPDQVSFYILKDGQRIIVDYKRDENGKVYPIYKMVTLTKKEGWQGLIKELDPKLLERAAYGLEEEALEGFKMSYTLKKVLVDPREKKDDKEDDVKIQFRLSREYVFFSAFSPTYIVKQAGYIPQDENKIKDGNGFKNWLGDITVRLIVDDQIKEEKTMRWNGESLEDDNLLFGYDEKKPIVVNSGGHNIKVRYYNSMDSRWGYHDAGNPSVNLYLKKDEKGIYSLYVPNILIEGNFAKVFKVTEKDIEGIGKMAKYPEITDFNPNAKNLEPYYEYTFLVTNTELPPERPPHEPPEEPEEPPVSPPEEPEESPVIPPEEPEKPGEPPRKPGAPRTGIEPLAPYFLLAMTSSLGLGYFAGKKD